MSKFLVWRVKINKYIHIYTYRYIYTLKPSLPSLQVNLYLNVVWVPFSLTLHMVNGFWRLRDIMQPVHIDIWLICQVSNLAIQTMLNTTKIIIVCLLLPVTLRSDLWPTSWESHCSSSQMINKKPWSRNNVYEWKQSKLYLAPVQFSSIVYYSPTHWW